MKHDTPNSGLDWDGMFRTRVRPLRPSTRERDFLADRAADARTAIGRTLREMQTTLAQRIGLRACAARHPWFLAGSALAAGILTGVVLTPAAREPAAPRSTKSLLYSLGGTVLATVLQPLIQRWFVPANVAQDELRSGPPSISDATGALIGERGSD